MAGKHENSPEHAKAHDLADAALDKAIAGDEAKARDLAKQARKVDPRIGDEMAREVAEDRRKADRYDEPSRGG